MEGLGRQLCVMEAGAGKKVGKGAKGGFDLRDGGRVVDNIV